MSNEKNFGANGPDTEPLSVEFAEAAETAEMAEAADTAETAEGPEGFSAPADAPAQEAPNPAPQTRREVKQAAKANAPRPRYVGRFTLGICLILVGVVITASMLVPDLNLLWFAKLLPLVLVALGLEILISSLRKDGRPVKVGFGTTLLCLVLIGGSVLAAMLPGLWKYFGPEQRAKEQQIQNQIERVIYEQIDPAAFEQIQVLVNFWDLDPDPHVRIDASLAGEFESAEAFAQKALPLVQAAASYNDLEIDALYINSNDAYGNWSLSFDPVYPWKDTPAEALAQKVNHTDVVLTQNGLSSVGHSDFERMKQEGVLATADAVEEAYNRGLAEQQSALDAANRDLEDLQTRNEQLAAELDTLRSAG